MKVVAAIIIKKNKYFIAQRNKSKHLGLKWEFPGGKVDANESLEEALKREIREELNIEIATNASENDLNEAKRQLSMFCPIAKVIRNSGTVIIENWKVIN